MAKAESSIFGLGCTSLAAASTTYLKWLKKKGHKLPKASYVGSATYFKKDTARRLLMVEGVNTLFDILTLLGPNDRVLVSDSPILLSEIPNVPILDVVPNPNTQWSFTLKPFDPAAFHRCLTRSWDYYIPVGSLQWTRLDQLGLLVDNNTTGMIATPYKNVSAQLDHNERQTLRRDVAAWSSGTLSLAQLDSNLRTRLKTGPVSDSVRTTLIAALTQSEATVRTALPLLAKNKSVVSTLKGSDITPFELRFLQKMISTKVEA